MGRFLRFLVKLAFLALLAGAAYIALSDIPPPERPVTMEVPRDTLFPDG